MGTNQELDGVLKALESNEGRLMEELRAAVAIQSVSNDPSRYPECLKMGEFLIRRILELGGEVQARSDTATVEGPDGVIAAIPPILLASFGSDSEKKTVCAYGHYDVMPAAMEEGWSRDPFVMEEIDSKFHGRGTSDDKGPVMSWLAVIHAHRQAGVELPINLKLCFEGREEAGSNGLELLVEQECSEGGFFSDVDYIVISDSGAIGTKSCITYGLRGISEFEVVVSGPVDNLHSGLYGGPVREPMHDLLKVLASLTTDDGAINIPAITETVAELTKEEADLYKEIEFEPENWIKSSSIPGVLGETTKENILMRRWRYPSLTVHGVKVSSDYMATCIPGTCSAHFSIRTVPYMEGSAIQDAVQSFLREEFDKLGSPNTLEVKHEYSADWFLADVNDANYQAAREAHRLVHKCEPDLIREGGSIPITISFSKITKKSVCLLPICGPTDNIHGPNESMIKSNLFKGAQVMAAYLHQIAANSSPDQASEAQ